MDTRIIDNFVNEQITRAKIVSAINSLKTVDNKTRAAVEQIITKSFCEDVVYHDASHYDPRFMELCRQVLKSIEKKGHPAIVRRKLKEATQEGRGYLMREAYWMLFATLANEDGIELEINNPLFADAIDKRDNYEQLKDEMRSYIAGQSIPSGNVSTKRIILHVGPTNSGKTYQSLERLMEAKTGAYLGPLRALALEVSEKLNKNYVPCDMITGEESKLVDGATHVASTVEMLDFQKEYEVAVIDECQMINDENRGAAWTRAIVRGRAKEFHLISAPEAADVLIKLIELHGGSCEVVNHERLTPLVELNKPIPLSKLKKGDALVSFSRKEQKHISWLLDGLGITHKALYGALPFEVRKTIVEEFVDGEFDVILTTDVIGMGVNVPIRRVVFYDSEKFDGKEKRSLRRGELLQIAGRAGRSGMHKQGFYGAVNKETLYSVKDIAAQAMESVETIQLDIPKRIKQFDFPLSQIYIAWNEVRTLTRQSQLFGMKDVKTELLLLSAIKDLCLTKDQEAKAISVIIPSTDWEYIEIWKNFVAAVNKKERTIMDLAWTSSLPRYTSSYHLEKLSKLADLHGSLLRTYGSQISNREEAEAAIKGCRQMVVSQLLAVS